MNRTIPIAMGGVFLFLCAPVFSVDEPLEDGDAKEALTKASPEEPTGDYRLTKRILTAKSNKPGRVCQLIAGYKNTDGKGFTLSALYHENATTLKKDWDEQHEGLKKRSPEIQGRRAPSSFGKGQVDFLDGWQETVALPVQL